MRTLPQTAASVAEFINANRNCFAIENHQGAPGGPERILDWPQVETADAIKYLGTINAAGDTDELETALCAVVLAAWISRGNQDGIPTRWINGASGDCCDLDLSKIWLQTWDVFRARNNNSGMEHVGTVEAADEDAALWNAEKTFDCDKTCHLFVEYAATEEQSVPFGAG